MSVQPLDDPGLTQAWRQIERRLGLLSSFGLIVVFVRDPVLLAPLKQRVLQWLGGGAGLADVSISPTDPSADATLVEVFSALDRPGVRVCWLDAHRREGVERWDAVRSDLLARLNERRGPLEAALQGGLILLLPEGGLRTVASIAPDLWHVRTLTLTLALSGARPFFELDAAELQGLVCQAVRVGDITAPSRTDWLHRWQALALQTHQDRGAGLTEALLDFQLMEGVVEARRALARGQFRLAMEIGHALLDLADAHAGVAPSGAESQAVLWERTHALLTRCEAFRAYGDEVAALADCRAAVQVSKLFANAHGDTELSALLQEATLDALWFAMASQGDWSGAEAVLVDLLELERQHLRMMSDPGALRLAVTRLAWGAVRAAQGGLSDAMLAAEDTLRLANEALKVGVDGALAHALIGQAVFLTARVQVSQGETCLAVEQLSDLSSLAGRSTQGVTIHADLLAKWVGLLPSAALLLITVGDAPKAKLSADVAVQLSRVYVEQDNRSSRSLWLHWRSLTAAKTVSPTPELEGEMSGLKMEWSTRFPELPPSPELAGILSSGVPIPGVFHSNIPPSAS